MHCSPDIALIIPKEIENAIQISSISDLEQRLISSICNDLYGLNFKFSFEHGKFKFENSADFLNRDFIRNMMSYRRNELIFKNKDFINKNKKLFTENIADGGDCLKSHIKPSIEVCETQKQRDLFRLLRFTWSSPYSEYVGRRIKFIIRDMAIKYNPVIGIAAIGSSIIRIPERDRFIGWDAATKNKNLIYCMDLYVCGALPPYNYLLGGKLISYLMASKEIRKIFEEKYFNKITLINERKSSDLAAIFTTSLYGRSSQYNRIKYNDKLLYWKIGKTKGYGTFQFSPASNDLLKEYLIEKEKKVGYKFGDGPNYKFRFIKKALDLLNVYGFNSDLLLNHSIKRDIYYIPLASNSTDFLNGKAKKLHYYNYSADELVQYWRNRWFLNRKKNEGIKAEIKSFSPENFFITNLLSPE
jgi:hypothetical protein